MSASHVTLGAQATERKARLAQLKSLKRKQPSSDGPSEETAEEAAEADSKAADNDSASTPDVSTLYLSGRNYDASTRGPKLGFESAPTEDTPTVEEQAAAIVETTKVGNEDDNSTADKPIDLFKLQPKKPNWDLKRDLQRKLDVLNVRTENAIARLVREKIEAAKEKARSKSGHTGNGDGEEVGMDGTTLVEGVHAREREEDEEKSRGLDDDIA